MIERELGNWKDFIEVMLRKVIPETKYKQQEPAEQVLNRKVEKGDTLACRLLLLIPGAASAGSAAHQHKEQRHE